MSVILQAAVEMVFMEALALSPQMLLFLPPTGFIGRQCEEYPEELDSVVRDTARTGIVR